MTTALRAYLLHSAFMTLSVNNTRHSNALTLCYHVLFIVMLSVSKLSVSKQGVSKQGVSKLSVSKLKVGKLSAIMLSVEMPRPA
jgi:hypothetical protein